VKALLGAAIVAGHAVALVALAPDPPEFAVTLDARPAAPHLAIAGDVPAPYARRVRTSVDGDGPGLDRKRWSIGYRGGFVREVGASQLVGPFQDPEHPPCNGRIVVGQHLLDAAAPVIARALDDELRGEHLPLAGDYVAARDVTVRWAQLPMHLADVAFASAAASAPGAGYIRVTATLAFDRVAVPVVVALVPELAGGGVRVRGYARATVEVDNRVLDWLAGHLGGDRLVSALARRELDGALAEVLAPPPPLPLPGGGELRLVPCGDLAIADGMQGAVGFAVAIARGSDDVLPPLVGAVLPPPRVGGGGLAIDVGVDAIDAMLYVLWRAGTLDRELADVGLDRKFAADPTVAELVSVRLAPVKLALPPVIAAVPGGLRLAVEARSQLRDGDAVTPARLYGALVFGLAPGIAAVPVTVDAVELACERGIAEPGRERPARVALVACYGDLVGAMRDRAGELQAPLGDAFAQEVRALFVDRRVEDPALPAALVIERATPVVERAGVHVELAGKLVQR
jgi:hypothetical protein